MSEVVFRPPAKVAGVRGRGAGVVAEGGRGRVTGGGR